jgi:1,4-dihydroxy-2-naphthoate octaprenyltransferase
MAAVHEKRDSIIIKENKRMNKETEKEKIANSTFKRWIYAARPKTLLASVSPLLLSAAAALWYSYKTGVMELHWGAFVLCVLFAGLMQIDSNLINDYVDYIKGTDDDNRLGPPRACAMGWIAPGTMRTGIAVVTLLACAVGLPLAFIGGWPMIVIGIVCVLFAFLYSTWCSYHALGDVLVLVFFGLVPVFTTYYLMTFHLSWEVLVIALGSGITTDTLLITNNYRDMDTDAKVGKRTLVTVIGRKWTRRLYLWTGIIAIYCAFPLYCDSKVSLPVWVCLSTFRICQHRMFYKEFITLPVKGLNKHLMHCSLSILSYALIYSIGLGIVWIIETYIK